MTANASRGRLFLATGNAGKVREMQALFAGSGFELARVDAYESPAEGAERYTDNAALKARTLHAALHAMGTPAAVVADDSGLEVVALGGRPGVLTAEYAGAGAGWAVRRARLLEELAASHSTDRRARFVCALHYVAADGRELATFATVDGEIARAEAGVEGFSFDPIFWYPPAGRTFAQLTDEQKNRISHRAVATAGLLAAIDAANAELHAASEAGARVREAAPAAIGKTGADGT